MTPEEHIKATKFFNLLIKNYIYENNASLRDFAIEISECISDVSKWKNGKKHISVRAIVKICRLFAVTPHELNPDHFPSDLRFVFDLKTKYKLQEKRNVKRNANNK
jgi:hypothetical protein